MVAVSAYGARTKKHFLAQRRSVPASSSNAGLNTPRDKNYCRVQSR